MQFANIIVIKKGTYNNKEYTYNNKNNLNIIVGQLVEIEFGKKTEYGVITKTHNQKPDFEDIKEIKKIHLESFKIKEWQLSLIKYISDYYLVTPAQAAKLFIPSFLLKESKKLVFELKKKSESKLETNIKLNKQQESILKTIFKEPKSPYLIHGITGSGKTEIYYHLINKFTENNKQALLLVPEISLTPQLIKNTTEKFGDKVAVLHSKQTPKEKRENYLKIYNNQANIIIGPRSAIFSPFNDLGIIIMDEEHDNSYKSGQTPKYYTHNIAEYLNKNLEIPLIYGSATPNIELYAKALSPKTDLILLNLEKRAISKELPDIEIVDLCEELKAKNTSIISNKLRHEMIKSIGQNEQVLLLLNKRGIAKALLCRECGDSILCPKCEFPFTLHKLKSPKLICHYCNLVNHIPPNCPTCKSIYLKEIGTGTEKIENELKQMFPDQRILRVDRDNIKTNKEYKEFYKKILDKEADIIIGTQMISKGLDIKGINLVGILLADIGMHIPEYKSNETLFQLLTQVSGRSGRDTKKGKVIIQTYNPDHEIIQNVKKHDFLGFLKAEINERKKHKFPPYSKLATLTISDKNKQKAKTLCEEKYQKFLTIINKLNIEKQVSINKYPALMFKKSDQYYYKILINNKSPKQIKLQEILKELDFKIPWKIDIDPIEIL